MVTTQRNRSSTRVIQRFRKRYGDMRDVFPLYDPYCFANVTLNSVLNRIKDLLVLLDNFDTSENVMVLSNPKADDVVRYFTRVVDIKLQIRSELNLLRSQVIPDCWLQMSDTSVCTCNGLRIQYEYFLSEIERRVALMFAPSAEWFSVGLDASTLDVVNHAIEQIEKLSDMARLAVDGVSSIVIETRDSMLLCALAVSVAKLLGADVKQMDFLKVAGISVALLYFHRDSVGVYVNQLMDYVCKPKAQSFSLDSSFLSKIIMKIIYGMIAKKCASGTRNIFEFADRFVSECYSKFRYSNAIVDLIDNFSEICTFCVNWISRFFLDVDILDVSDHGKSSVDTYTQLLHDLEKSLLTGEKAFNASSYAEFLLILRMGQNLIFDTKDSPYSRILLEVIKSQNSRITKLMDKFMLSNLHKEVTRMVPLFSMILGPSGTGKSLFISLVISRMINVLPPSIQKFYGTATANVMKWYFPKSNDHHDGYNGQPIFIIDDWGQRKDTPQNPNPEVMAIIDFVNCEPFPMKMADIASKGTMFNSLLGYASTNVTNFEHEITSITSIAALKRRMHICVLLSVKPQFKKGDGIYDPWVDTLDVLKLPHDPENNIPIVSPLHYDIHILNLDQKDSNGRYVIERTVDFETFISISTTKFRELEQEYHNRMAILNKEPDYSLRDESHVLHHSHDYEVYNGLLRSLSKNGLHDAIKKYPLIKQVDGKTIFSPIEVKGTFSGVQYCVPVSHLFASLYITQPLRPDQLLSFQSIPYTLLCYFALLDHKYNIRSFYFDTRVLRFKEHVLESYYGRFTKDMLLTPCMDPVQLEITLFGDEYWITDIPNQIEIEQVVPLAESFDWFSSWLQGNSGSTQLTLWKQPSNAEDDFDVDEFRSFRCAYYMGIAWGKLFELSGGRFSPDSCFMGNVPFQINVDLISKYVFEGDLLATWIYMCIVRQKFDSFAEFHEWSFKLSEQLRATYKSNQSIHRKVAKELRATYYSFVTQLCDSSLIEKDLHIIHDRGFTTYLASMFGIDIKIIKGLLKTLKYCAIGFVAYKLVDYFFFRKELLALPAQAEANGASSQKTLPDYPNDKVLSDIKKSIFHKNLYEVCIEDNGKVVRLCFVTFYCGTRFVTNSHSVSQIEKHPPSAVLLLRSTQPGTPIIEVGRERFKNLSHIPNSEIGTGYVDLLAFPLRPDIRNKFVPSNYSFKNEFNACWLSYDGSVIDVSRKVRTLEYERKVNPFIKSLCDIDGDGCHKYTLDGHTFKSPGGVFYRCNRTVGDCGYPIFLEDSGMRHQRIFALHAAGSAPSIDSYATFINYDHICAADNLHDAVDTLCSHAPHLDLPVAHCRSPYVNEGDFNNKAKQVLTSKITPSLMYESIDPTPFVLSDLSQKTSDVAKRYSIKPKRALSKNLVSASVADMIRSISYDSDGNVFKFKFASFGNAITAECFDKVKSLNLGTSSGYPLIWQVKGIKGKKSIVGSWSPGEIGKMIIPLRSSIYDYIYDNNCFDASVLKSVFPISFNKYSDYYWDLSWLPNIKLLVDDIKLFLSNLDKGIYTQPVYVDYQKDELLKPGKDTRIFSCAPLWYTILVRMYIGCLMDWCSSNCLHNEMAIGLNPYSEEWDRLARFLGVFDKKCPSDFKKYDTDANSEIMGEIALQISERFYGGVSSNIGKISFFLLYGVCFTLHIMDEFYIAMWYLGMASGNPFTAPMNCWVQKVLFRMCFGQRFGVHLIPRFSEFVKLITLGDDGTRSVSSRTLCGLIVSEAFNPEYIRHCMRDYGYTITSTDKETVCSYVEWKDIEFLKRGFSYSRSLGRHVAPLNFKSMLKMLYYTKVNDTDISYTNYQKFMWELSYHGSVRYNEVLTLLSKVADERNVKFPTIIPYSTALLANSARQYDEHDDFLLDASDLYLEDFGFIDVVLPRGESRVVGINSNKLIYTSMDTEEHNEAERQSNVTEKVPQQNIVEFVSSGAIVDGEPAKQTYRPFGKYVDGVIGSQTEDIKSFLARPIQVYRAAVAPAKNSEPFNISLPDGVTGYYSAGTLTSGQSIYSDKLKGFLGMRCDFNVKVIVNAQPFQQGAFMLRFVPFTGTMVYERDQWNADLILKSQQHRVVVDINCDTEANLYIPYCYPAPFFNLLQNNKLNIYNMGTVYMTGYADFKTGAASTSTDFEVSIYISCHNVELMGPSYPSAQSSALMSKKVAGGSSDKEKRPAGAPPHPISHTGKFVESAADLAKQIPLLSAFSEPLKWMGRLVDVPMAYFGFATPVLNNTQTAVQQLDRQYWNNCDQPRHAYVMGITSDNAIVHTHETSMTEFDEMSINYIASRWSYYKTANWTTSTAVDAQVFRTDINPAAFASTGNTIGLTNNVVYPTPIYYVAQPFTYWRGDIKLKFRILKTQFHSGRLILLFIPGNTATLGGLSSISTTNSQFLIREIIDIREGNVFEYTIPYIYPDMWNTFAQGGAVYLVVQNLLRATDQVANNIDIICEVCAGDNFEVAVPRQLGMSPICPTAQSYCEISSGVIGGYNVSADNESPTALCIGEKISSIRQYLQRFHNMRHTTSPGNAYFSFVPWICSAYSPASSGGALQNNGSFRPDAWSYFGACYALFRGGVMLSIDNYGNTDTQVLVINDPVNNTITDAVTDYTAAVSSYCAGSGTNYICPPVSQVGSAFVKAPFYHQNPATYFRKFYGPSVIVLDSDNRYTSHLRVYVRYKSSGVVSTPRIMRALADDASFQFFVACVPLTASQV